MKLSSKLLAAITASGAVLSLDVSAQAHQAANRSDLIVGREPTPLSARVEQMRNKLRATSPMFGKGPAQEPIDNVVQFFNFLNR
jgi:hypothetical protein